MMYLGQDVKVAISVEPWSGSTSIWIAIKDSDGLSVADPIELTLRRAEEGQIAEPTLRLSSEFAHELFTALAEALENEGIKPPSEAFLHGELEATKRHLEDMRKIALGRRA